MKKTISFFVSLFIGLLCLGYHSDGQAQNALVTITGIKNEKGQIVLNVFKDDKSYDKEAPFKKINFPKKDIVNGTMVVTCNLEPGVYGITLLDDENSNGVIDRNMIGMPKEGFGFSNFYLEKMKKPSFDEFKIEIKAGGNKVAIKVKYM